MVARRTKRIKVGPCKRWEVKTNAEWYYEPGKGSAVFHQRGNVCSILLEWKTHIMILIESAVNGRHLLKRIDLAASLHVEAHCIFNIKLTLKARALFENVEVWAISAPPHRPSGSPACFLSLTPKYDKEFVSHG